MSLSLSFETGLLLIVSTVWVCDTCYVSGFEMLQHKAKQNGLGSRRQFQPLKPNEQAQAIKKITQSQVSVPDVLETMKDDLCFLLVKTPPNSRGRCPESRDAQQFKRECKRSGRKRTASFSRWTNYCWKHHFVGHGPSNLALLVSLYR